jgi:hypothetical protein
MRNAMIALLCGSTPAAVSLGCGPQFGIDSGGDEGDEDDGAGGGGSGQDQPGGGGSCIDEVELELEAIPLPPDLVVVLDRSSSMGQPVTPGGFDQKWLTIVDALGDVAETYMNRVQFGLMLVPGEDRECDAGSMNIMPTPNSGKNFYEYLQGTTPGGASPMASSINAARSYFNSAPVNPYGRYVLLTTDGVPTCAPLGEDAVDYTVDAIRDLKNMGIKTFVLGYATSSEDYDGLDRMAAAGGTGAHVPATSSYDLLNKLEDITDELSQVKCEYQLSSGPNDPLDLVVNIGGSAVPYSPDHTDGYDYDPATRFLTFYGDSCDALRTSDADAGFSINYCNDVD